MPEQTELLVVLHELLFCCDTLVVGDSSLSSAAAMATQARNVVAATPFDLQLGFKHEIVIEPMLGRPKVARVGA